MIDAVIQLPTPARKRTEALSLMQQAWGEQDVKTRLQLAQRALDLNPTCIGALALLAIYDQLAPSVDPIRALEQAVALEAGQLQAAGLDVKFAGNYWSSARTRVYLRALAVLVRLYLRARDWSAAKETCQEMLELDRRDAQGQRYTLGKLLVRDGEYAAFHALDEQFKRENSVMFLFNRALVAYIEQGRCAESDALAKRALIFNPLVVRYFEALPEADAVSRNVLSPEAMATTYVKESQDVWARTPGAIRWLSGVLAAMRSA